MTDYLNVLTPTQLGIIKDLSYETTKDIFGPDAGSELVLQDPPVAQRWIELSPNLAPGFLQASDGSEITLPIQKSWGNVQEVLMDIKFAFGGTQPTPAVLAPFICFTKMKLFHGATIIINYTDSILLYHYYLQRLPELLRNALVSRANDQTLGGNVAQSVPLPLPWSQLLSGLNRQPFPTGSISQPLSFLVTPRAINKWTNGSDGTTTSSIVVKWWVQSAFYNGAHTDTFRCGYEVPILTGAGVQTVVAATQTRFMMAPGVAQICKGVYFLFQDSATDLAVNNYFKGGNTDGFAFNPHGTLGYTLPNLNMVKSMMLSQHIGFNPYNTTTSVAPTNTFTNCFFYCFGPRYSVQDLLSLYYFEGTTDASSMDLTFATAGKVFVLPIAYQIIEFNPKSGVIEFPVGLPHN